MDVLGFLSGLILGASVIVIMSIPLFVKRAVETYAEKAVGSVFEKKDREVQGRAIQGCYGQGSNA